MAPDLDSIFSHLRRLSRKVHTPPRLPTREEVDQAERRLGVALHPDYWRYLLEASDVSFGTLETVTITVPGAHTDLFRVTADGRKYSGLPPDYIPICEDNGDLYCHTPSGEVVFWPHDGTSEERWPSLAGWIEEVWIGGN